MCRGVNQNQRTKAATDLSKKDVLKSSSNFTGKPPYLSLFIIMLQSDESTGMMSLWSLLKEVSMKGKC